jgi:hypothetical protein
MGPRSGGRSSSVCVVVSSPDNILSSLAHVQKDVILRLHPNGRLGQSVSYTIPEETPNDDIPLLLDMLNDEDNDQMCNLAEVMEEEFFGKTPQDPAVEEKQRPVCMLAFPPIKY